VREVTRKNGGRNNALKHGVFAQDLILPGESCEDLENLYQSLIEELKPKGPLEDDTVRTFAKCLWAKRRAERFYHQEGTWAQEHPDDERPDYVDLAARALDHAKTFEHAAEIVASLPENYRSSLEKTIPASWCGMDLQRWITDLKSCLLNLIETDEVALSGMKAEPKFKAEQAARLREITAKKIVMDERLDTMIDKAIKRLAQLKMFKQAIGSQASQPKAIEHHSITGRRR
jgi:hypothetical protein